MHSWLWAGYPAVEFFFGAFYLFVINTVFIALATFIIVRSFHFPAKHFQSERAEKIAQRIIWIVVLITLTPSIYFGYEKVQQNKFMKNAEQFISFEADFPNDYLLSKKIDAGNRKMVLVFGGKEISEKEIADLKDALGKYNLQGTKLEIKQGFSYLATDHNDKNENATQLSIALSKQEEINKQLRKVIDSINSEDLLCAQLFNEIKAQYPVIRSGIIRPARTYTDSSSENNTILISLFSSRAFLPKEKQQLNNWLTVRLNKRSYKLLIED